MTNSISPTSALSGVHAATVCPMTETGSIHQRELAEHVRSVTSPAGIRGLLVNGHAGEGHLLHLD